jgi:predicted HTH transcriptional regulator
MITSLTGKSDLECADQLLAAGLISFNQFKAIKKRIEREESKDSETAKKQDRINELKALALQTMEANPETLYFGVKSKGKSIIGFIDAPQFADESLDRANPEHRQLIREVINALTDDGSLTKVGFSQGEEKDPSEVNAFQLRYKRTTVM